MEVENSEIATFEEKCQAIEKALTDVFYTYLIKYATYRINKKTKISYDFDRGIRGVLVQDLISDVLESLLRRDGRNWNKTKFPDIKLQIISALDSVIFNTVKSELEKYNDTYEIFENDGFSIPENDEYQELINLCTEFLKDLGATDDEMLLFEPYIIHEMKRKDLAELFNLEVSDLTNIKKKLDRKLPILKEKLIELGYEK